LRVWRGCGQGSRLGRGAACDASGACSTGIDLCRPADSPSYQHCEVSAPESLRPLASQGRSSAPHINSYRVMTHVPPPLPQLLAVKLDTRWMVAVERLDNCPSACSPARPHSPLPCHWHDRGHVFGGDAGEVPVHLLLSRDAGRQDVDRGAVIQPSDAPKQVMSATALATLITVPPPLSSAPPLCCDPGTESGKGTKLYRRPT